MNKAYTRPTCFQLSICTVDKAIWKVWKEEGDWNTKNRCHINYKKKGRRKFQMDWNTQEKKEAKLRPTQSSITPPHNKFLRRALKITPRWIDPTNPQVVQKVYRKRGGDTNRRGGELRFNNTIPRSNILSLNNIIIYFLKIIFHKLSDLYTLTVDSWLMQSIYIFFQL